MASHTNSDDKDLALTLRLSLLSANESGEETAQPFLKGLASANHASRPTTPPGDETDNLALAPRLSPLSSDDFDEEVSQCHSKGSAPAGDKAHLTTPSYENNEGDFERAPTLSRLAADEQGVALDQQGEGCASIEATLTSSHTEISRSEDDIRRSLFGLLESMSGDNSESPSHHDYLQALILATQGTSMLKRYEISGVLGELEEGINALRNANRFMPENHLMKAGCLNGLGVSLQSRFECLGDIADLHEAIIAHQQAVRLTPECDPAEPGHLSNLGISFLNRFKRLGDTADLEEAITAQQQVVRLTPEGHPNKPMYLNNLGVSFQNRFKRLGNVTDVDEAITTTQQAIHCTPEGHPDNTLYLNNLEVSFQGRFERLGNIADLHEAIMAHQQAVRLTPECHPAMPGRLNSLGISFESRFERLGDIADLDLVIIAKQHAVRLTPEGHPDKPMYLNNLGVSFQNRFEHLGDVADVDEAITATQQAVRCTPEDHPDRPRHLNNLGISFQSRFERLGDMDDLGEAIKAHQQAISLTPKGHPAKPMFLNDLGNSFQSWFERLGDIVDLNEAITAKQQAVSLSPDGHPDKPAYFNSLGVSLRHRFERPGDIADVDEAIKAQHQATHLIPDGHPAKPAHFNNLGNSFQSRFERLGDIADLDKAIMAQQQAIRLTPEGHRDKAGRCNNLGASFYARFRSQPDDATLVQAIKLYSQSANSSSGPPSVRFTAARMWATLCFSVHSNETLDAYSVLVDLIPRVVWIGRTVEQRYKEISSIGYAVTDAAAAAIHFGKFDLALEWLEQGRSIVWGQILQLRTPLDELRQLYPSEADELEKISGALDASGVTYSLSDGASQALEMVAQAHRRRAEEYDHILARIRSFPGFSEFLRPQKSAYLCGAAISGPVVIINAPETRCDALILLPHSSQVSHVPLPTLHISGVQEMQRQLAVLTRGANIIQRHYDPHGEGMELSDILGKLWWYIVQPILDYLKLLQKPTDGEMPHITWCLTGPLTFLPIHAAGCYDAKNAPKIFDYVVSSYTPTLTALLTAKHHPPKSGQTVQLLTISQPATPHQTPLPGTVAEVDTIETLQSTTDRLHITRLDDREATTTAVLHHMKECNWIHLACHGVQDTASPIESAFSLIDKPLTLREIMKQSFSHAELAFLSACQTATGHSKLPEEAIHLAAGMLMAGYGSVMATMWSIRDNDAPIIAEKFYEYLIEEAGGDSTKAAYALHDAVVHLRNLRGEKDFARWVPFIHLGICSPRGPLPEW